MGEKSTSKAPVSAGKTLRVSLAPMCTLKGSGAQQGKGNGLVGHRSSLGPEDVPQHPARAPPTPAACVSERLEFWPRETGWLSAAAATRSQALRQAPCRQLHASWPLGLGGDQVAPRPGYRAGSGPGPGRGGTPLCLAQRPEDRLPPDQLGRAGMCRPSSHPPPQRIRVSGGRVSPAPRTLNLGLRTSRRQNWVCAQGRGALSTPPTRARTLRVEFSMTHKRAGRLWRTCRPAAHVQPLIGAACSISAPDSNEVTQPAPPEMNPAGRLGAQGPSGPAACLGEATKPGSGQPGKTPTRNGKIRQGAGVGNVAGRPREPAARPWGPARWGAFLAGWVVGWSEGRRARGAPEVTETLGVSAADPRSTCTARRGPQGSSLPSTTPAAEKHS